MKFQVQSKNSKDNEMMRLRQNIWKVSKNWTKLTVVISTNLYRNKIYWNIMLHCKGNLVSFAKNKLQFYLIKQDFRRIYWEKLLISSTNLLFWQFKYIFLLKRTLFLMQYTKKRVKWHLSLNKSLHGKKCFTTTIVTSRKW